jgi:hypothetical protein
MAEIRLDHRKSVRPRVDNCKVPLDRRGPKPRPDECGDGASTRSAHALIGLAHPQLCDGHHKKALFIAELRKKNRAFLTAPALAGISNDLMQSQEATDNCRRRPIGLCADAQIRDDGPNMETYHEGTYRSSRVGHADCGPDIRSPGERGSDVPGELLIRL